MYTFNIYTDIFKIISYTYASIKYNCVLYIICLVIRRRKI